MSSTTLYIAKEDGIVQSHQTFQNSWGAAPFIWSALVKKYSSEMYRNHPKNPEFMGDWVDLWDRVKDGTLNLEWWEYNTLIWTYDYVALKREDFALMAESMQKFAAAHCQWDKISHVRGVAATLEKLSQQSDIILSCTHMTSTSDNLWYIRLPDNAEEEERPYNFLIDTKHEFLECRKSQ